MYDAMVKYLIRYAEPFEAMDSVFGQFSLNIISSNQSNGWIVIPREESVKLLIKSKV